MSINNVYDVRAAKWLTLPLSDRHGIMELASELRGLFDLKNRNFIKYADKFCNVGDSMLSLYKFDDKTGYRNHLEYALCVLKGAMSLNEKERGRIRLVIDGISGPNTKQEIKDFILARRKSNASGLQWNKAAMTSAHDHKRGKATGKVTANYKSK
jgi:hypothetical protein